ncbi:MAG: glutamate--tRNA ligase [Deferribacteraceae bacterium]|jgi:glutamyl-tRNA synthetase|nr:glutamate--tRNA ligase [Deferribacteraceae bacterium]
MSVRVRFAPSPTGHLHVGNVRTALFNYLFAGSKGGTFVLRIEDTDLERSTAASEQLIYEDLKWLGLKWDEGEGAGGEYGPYLQTGRFQLYNEATAKLLKERKAYYCFCTKEELDAEREKALKENRLQIYNGKCRRLNDEEVERRINNGENPAVRFHSSKPYALVRDLIHGDITFPSNAFGDFIIVRPDGVPVYNYAVVVDDALMKITHVIRGDDHLPNTPKHTLLFEALGYEPPLFAHIPMILGPDRSKLSKRHGNTSIEQFRAQGYLPEAMINFMALLSWSDTGEQEIFSMEKLIERFSLDRVSSSAAVFDFEKLKWMNGLYIRAAGIDEITALAVPFIIAAGQTDSDFVKNNAGLMSDIVASVRDNFETVSDAPRYTAVYFSPLPEFDDETKEILALSTTRPVLESFLKRLDGKDRLSADEYKELMKEVQKDTGVKGKPLYMGVRAGVTGRTKGPELDRFVPLMPAEKLRERIEQVLSSV